MRPAPWLAACLALPWSSPVAAMSAARLAELRKSTVEVFKHGYENYMDHAFPEDELRPVSCTPLTRDPLNPSNYDLNDVLGNYSLTLIDSLSTLAVLAGTPSDEETANWALHQFQDGVAKFVHYYGDGRRGPSGKGERARGFDLDSKVQVFETVIRGVGGLLSAHLFAIGELPIPNYRPSRPSADYTPPDPLEWPPIAWPDGFRYDGQLLRLALDLAERLLPAFYTTTGLPYPRVNLRHGIPFYINSPLHKVSPDDPDSTERSREKTDTCSAGAGSLVLEFTVLSRLTDDPRFENLAKRAFWTVWKNKSDIGLVGNAIDPEKGEWVSYDTGIGAGVDSFFEYALKSHILLSGHDTPNITVPLPPTDREWLDPNILHSEPLTPEEHSSGAFLEAWHQAHAAIKRHLYNDVHHPYYMTGHRTRGYPFTGWIDSLAAFYPGLLAMAGEVDEGQNANLLYTALWTRYGALPERWSVRDRQIDSGIGWWPGRPEFIESNYYLYRATNDPWYLHVGEMVLSDIDRLCRTKCGWSGLQNVDTGEKADRMQSFFLGETTKYLYLLFDPDHPFNKLDKEFVFSTEAHPLIIPRRRPAWRSKQQKQHDRLIKDLDTYYDQGYTNTCPAPVKVVPLTGSVLAASPDTFQAASFVLLHRVPNPYSGMEEVPAGKDAVEPTLRYKSNHTFFPWTLPASKIPENGTCAALAFKTTLLIEFPSSVQRMDAGSALNQLFANSAAIKTPTGAKIISLNGLKVTFVKEETSDIRYDHVWRVTHVNHIALGKDEVVHLDADLIGTLSDPLFNRIKYPSYADLVLVFDDGPEENTTAEMPIELFEDTLDAEAGDSIRLSDNDEVPWIQQADQDAPSGRSLDPSYGSMLKSIMRAVTSVFDPSFTPAPNDASADNTKPLRFETYKASLPVGKGAVPLPDTPDAALLSSVGDAQGPTPLDLPWTTFFLAGEACDDRLPDAAPRDHHVIVIRRGGCSFSTKLANIPAVPASSRSLKLVVIVDDIPIDEPAIQGDGPPLTDEEHMVQPHLDEEQRTPGGMPRHRPVSMLMIRGGARDGHGGAYAQFARATGAGIRRKYFIETQGRRVDNIIIL
ncbi:endoplasmic reticulum mannosyl-oligosaccharide 1,2-alpha-mannosidase [Plectosphaerella plurivora]|uniref:alpha-1,2-Mannosidase n=1 Tax=Plectosphaerella plurivora TaxID=936078 RepID=A0A9P8VJ38_9PEZI|nr:endoplasmic reticulum mannosyl-oligosaccharide 1,2-alpha-mannosidase [Plectosphaerella plurivora]